MASKDVSPSLAIILGLLAFIIPLTFIAVSIIRAPWFSILDNALSDLGHAKRSNVAPLFNFGLSLGGFLVGLVSTYYVSRISKALSITLSLTGYSLILVAVFDEVYGYLHFMVSVLFFMSLAASLIAYAIVKRTILPIPLLIIGISAWVIHYLYDIPRGVAIPELISIIIVLPFYINLVVEATRT
ncbi:MAG: hypothetical protein DRZ82_05870 [Thermoprotei archaeon]|nr:MAG: hypothetical protein DRZ82_05870 [Thermoprotei archaeon]